MTHTPREFDAGDPAALQQPPTAGPYDSAEGAFASGPSSAGADPSLSAGTAAAPRTDGVAATEVPGGVARPAGTGGPERSAGTDGTGQRKVTRAGMVWAAVASALVVLILLIVFILQNQDYVQVKFFGLEGAVALGVALFIAAVGGGVLVAIAGAARIIQLRLAAHRQRTQGAGRR